MGREWQKLECLLKLVCSAPREPGIHLYPSEQIWQLKGMCFYMGIKLHPKSLIYL